MSEHLPLFYILLFVVAFLYASVGHGGASGYLALMAIYGVAPAEMKPTALLLNLFVSATSFLQYYRGGHFKWKIFLPFAIASIPLAYVGGHYTIEDNLYKKILGILLLFPIARFLFLPNTDAKDMKEAKVGPSLIIGGIIGLLSGMIGIGGGILLSPVLLLLKWTNQKQTAAISASFIFVNSVAGLIGMYVSGKGIAFNTHMYAYVGVAFVGGLCGAYLGSLKFNQNILKNVLAGVLMLAVYKLLFTTA